MGKKLDRGAYATIDDMEADFKLMIDNCLTYNNKDTVFYKYVCLELNLMCDNDKRKIAKKTFPKREFKKKEIIWFLSVEKIAHVSVSSTVVLLVQH